MANDTWSEAHAAEMVSAHLGRIGHDIVAWADLFADDAVIEFPYAPSLGTPARLEGKAAIVRYMNDVVPRMIDLAFTNVRVTSSRDASVTFVECHGGALIASTGRRYEQDYVMRIETRDGKIVHYREYWNPLPGLEAFGGAGALQASFGAR